MARLKSRQMQVPNGFKFLQPETGWKSTRFASFDSIVTSLIAHRRGRPDLVAKHKWSTDYDEVAHEVEQFNVRLCQMHGWNNYIDQADFGGGEPPKSMPLSQADQRQVSAAAGRVTKIWAGVKTLNEWIIRAIPGKFRGSHATRLRSALPVLVMVRVISPLGSPSQRRQPSPARSRSFKAATCPRHTTPRSTFARLPVPDEAESSHPHIIHQGAPEQRGVRRAAARAEVLAGHRTGQVKICVAYVYPVHLPRYDELACRFARTYMEFPPGEIDHEVHIYTNGGEANLKQRLVLDVLCPTYHAGDNVGKDIGAFSARPVRLNATCSSAWGRRSTFTGLDGSTGWCGPMS